MRILALHIYFSIIKISFARSRTIFTDDDELLNDEPVGGGGFSGSGDFQTRDNEDERERNQKTKDDPCRRVRMNYNTAMQHKQQEYRKIVNKSETRLEILDFSGLIIVILTVFETFYFPEIAQKQHARFLHHLF